MTPSFDPTSPGSILTDTLNQSEGRLSSAAGWALVILAVLGVVAMRSKRRR